MAVSLKKPSNDTMKVDLTKPSVSDKLPECTPVHLFDEEETINSRISQPKISIEQIRLHHSEEEEEHIWELYDKSIRYEKLKRVLTVITISVSVIVLTVFVVVLVLNIESFSGLFVIYPAVFDYLFSNSLFKIFLGITFLFLGIRLMSHMINILHK